MPKKTAKAKVPQRAPKTLPSTAFLPGHEPTPGAGRPTVYRPEFCEIVIAKGKEGGTRAQMALACGIDKSTFAALQKQHPAFSRAVSMALLHSQEVWELKGFNGCERGHGFNGQTYALLLKNIHGDDYKEKVDVKHSGNAFRDFMTGAAKGLVPMADDVHNELGDDKP